MLARARERRAAAADDADAAGAAEVPADAVAEPTAQRLMSAADERGKRSATVLRSWDAMTAKLMLDDDAVEEPKGARRPLKAALDEARGTVARRGASVDA